MIKKLMLAVAMMIAAMGFAFAQVDVNKADAAALDSVKGVGPKMSKTIIDERTKGGEFKDWADFQKRVKGVGDKSAMNLSKAGLQVGGKSKEGAEMAKPAADKMAKPADKMAKPADDKMAKPADDKMAKPADKMAKPADKMAKPADDKMAKPADKMDKHGDTKMAKPADAAKEKAADSVKAPAK
jgi:competence protein ComEA